MRRNRLPVLLLPGDVFANRIPDPVLQQVEAFGDGTVSANDCFRPVSRYFDRINRPEQLIAALQRTMAEDVRTAAYRIKAGKGVSNFGIGGCIARLVRAMVGDERKALTGLLSKYHANKEQDDDE